MSSKLASRLAQLANAKKQAEEVTPEEDQKAREAAVAAQNISAIQSILLPHVDEFNGVVDASLKIALEVKHSCILIKRSHAALLTLEITHKAAIFKRKPGEYTSDDYFTIGQVPEGTLTFSNYSTLVEKPMGPNQFAELVLMEALGLNGE